jgi:hypothetical protein
VKIKQNNIILYSLCSGKITRGCGKLCKKNCPKSGEALYWDTLFRRGVCVCVRRKQQTCATETQCRLQIKTPRGAQKRLTEICADHQLEITFGLRLDLSLQRSRARCVMALSPARSHAAVEFCFFCFERPWKLEMRLISLQTYTNYSAGEEMRVLHIQ